MGWCLIAATGEANWFLGWLTNLYLFGQVALGLGFVIFVHELGHFLAAKACGVKCEKFYVGFDVPVNLGLFKIPAKLFHFNWGETEYGIGAIPLGGYVKMLGQDDNPQAAEEEAARTKIEGPEGEETIDPRSYTAKSVPQRMLIISAGVVMNLIFAVILAAVAYMMGVAYVPAQIGGTLPGSPAWQADPQIDSQMVQIGEGSYRSEHLRWRDLMTRVMLGGTEQPIKFVIVPPGEEQEQTLFLQPQKHEGRKMPAIGVQQAVSTVISTKRAESKGHFTAFQAKPPLQTDDKIVAIDGQPVEAFHDIQRIWAARGSQPLTLTVERMPKDAKEGDKPKRVDSVVEANPVRDLGIATQIGPISELGIQVGSPAADAGLLPGDTILEVNGEPAGDALSFNDKLLPMIGETIELTLDRKGKRITKSITVRKPTVVYDAITRDAPVAVDTLGVAFEVTNVVESVAPDSPAEQAGLKSGDVIRKAQFIPANEEQQKIETVSAPGAGEGRGPFRSPAYVDELELGEKGYNWHLIHTRIQRSQPDTKVVITYERNSTDENGKQVTKFDTTDPMLPVASANHFFPSRGLDLKEISEVHQASFVEAWPLGLRETKERIAEVFIVLGKLFTGGLSPTNLSGAPGIVYGAVSEASQGYGRLFMFLTFLSCNLAVLNFLPIPVLDGGHMVFLLAEGLRGKPVDERLQMNLTFFGLMLLLGLMVFVFALDIGRLAGISGMIMW